MKLNSNQVDILDHTLRRAANNLYCGSSDDMQELVKLELMESKGTSSFCQDEYFSITEKGVKALKEFRQ